MMWAVYPQRSANQPWRIFSSLDLAEVWVGQQVGSTISGNPQGICYEMQSHDVSAWVGNTPVDDHSPLTDLDHQRAWKDSGGMTRLDYSGTTRLPDSGPVALLDNE